MSLERLFSDTGKSYTLQWMALPWVLQPCFTKDAPGKTHGPNAFSLGKEIMFGRSKPNINIDCSPWVADLAAFIMRGMTGCLGEDTRGPYVSNNSLMASISTAAFLIHFQNLLIDFRRMELAKWDIVQLWLWCFLRKQKHNPASRLDILGERRHKESLLAPILNWHLSCQNELSD